MIRTTVLAVAAAAVLGGCSMHHAAHHDRTDGLHHRPLITVRAGTISIAPEPVVLLRGRDQGRIVWSAPPGYTFADDGIEIKGRVIDRAGAPVRPNHLALAQPGLGLDPGAAKAFACELERKERRSFSCTVRDPAAPPAGVYRYHIRLRAADGSRLDWDPSIFAMD